MDCKQLQFLCVYAHLWAEESGSFYTPGLILFLHSEEWTMWSHQGGIVRVVEDAAVAGEFVFEPTSLQLRRELGMGPPQHAVL